MNVLGMIWTLQRCHPVERGALCYVVNHQRAEVVVWVVRQCLEMDRKREKANDKRRKGTGREGEGNGM